MAKKLSIADLKTMDEVMEFRKTVLRPLPPSDEKREMRAALRIKKNEILEQKQAEIQEK